MSLCWIFFYCISSELVDVCCIRLSRLPRPVNLTVHVCIFQTVECSDSISGRFPGVRIRILSNRLEGQLEGHTANELSFSNAR